MEKRGSVKILEAAVELQLKKSQDYQNPSSRVKQSDYYPRGVYTLLDTINAKYLRMISVLETMENGGKENFESVQDSAVDLINYGSFVAAYIQGEIPGQDGTLDIFGKTVTSETPQSNIPVKFRK